MFLLFSFYSPLYQRHHQYHRRYNKQRNITLQVVRHILSDALNNPLPDNLHKFHAANIQTISIPSKQISKKAPTVVQWYNGSKTIFNFAQACTISPGRMSKRDVYIYIIYYYIYYIYYNIYNK